MSDWTGLFGSVSRTNWHDVAFFVRNELNFDAAVSE